MTETHTVVEIYEIKRLKAIEKLYEQLKEELAEKNQEIVKLKAVIHRSAG
jgi:hypothetical protein